MRSILARDVGSSTMVKVGGGNLCLIIQLENSQSYVM